MSKRTIIDFEMRDDISPVVDAWAEETRYKLKNNEGPKKTYQKGTGFLVAPMMLEFTQTSDKIHLEAWVRANLFVRIFALFLVPSEIGIHKGGFKLAAPRKIARTAVNKLLEKLGQPVIE